MLLFVYKNQSALRIRVSCGLDITGALAKKIKYRKPSGQTGEWTAQVESAANGIIYYDVTSTGTIDEAGTWTIWPWLQFADGRQSPGSPLELTVLIEGEAL